jgi:hypothetical protein
LRAVGIAGLALVAGMVAAAAQDILPERITPERTQARAPEMKSPRISLTHVDWNAAAAELNTIDALKPAEAGEPRPSTPPMAPAELVAKLNQVTGERFAHIAASPVPVLLPFDTAAFLGDRVAAAGTPDAGSGTANTPNYLFGFNAVPFFYPGPGGYDAVVLA